MERVELLGHATQQAIILRLGSQFDWMPSDFAPRPFVDFCAKRGGEQLRPEAHAEHRPVVFQRALDEPHLLFQVRMLLGLVHALRPAHQDEASGALHIFGNRLTLEGADVLPRERRAFERLRDIAEIFDRMMLHDPDLRHA